MTAYLHLTNKQQLEMIRDVVDIMMDYRHRRMKWMIQNPQDAGEDDKTPSDLTRDAEAAAIIDFVTLSERMQKWLGEIKGASAPASQ
jgi:hypothetical protein